MKKGRNFTKNKAIKVLAKEEIKLKIMEEKRDTKVRNMLQNKTRRGVTKKRLTFLWKFRNKVKLFL